MKIFTIQFVDNSPTERYHDVYDYYYTSNGMLQITFDQGRESIFYPVHRIKRIDVTDPDYGQAAVPQAAGMTIQVSPEPEVPMPTAPVIV